MILITLMAVAGYFGWLLGRRWERGEIEAQQDHAAEIAYSRGQRPGAIRLNAVRIRR